MTICLYCNNEKGEDELSQEHVLPRGVGGAITTVNPFSIENVCIRCNSVLGFFVDSPFIKNWLINNHRAKNAKKFIKLSNTSILPLEYFGEINNLKFGNKLCEYWLGPTGDSIYHFHEPYPKDEDTPTIVGAPPTTKKERIDNGFVFIFVRSNNPEWLPTILNSTIANFKKATFYLGNGSTPPGDLFSDIPEPLIYLHKSLKKIQGKDHKISASIGIDAGERFLGKLALGFGSILLNDSFSQSKSADLLRELMWAKSSKKRKSLPIYGSGFFNNSEEIRELSTLFKWDGGHVIVAMKTNDILALYTNFYEENSAIINITNEKEHWENKIDEGICFVVVPGLQSAVGPIVLEEFIAHKIDASYKNKDLVKLEERMSKFNELPPFDI